MWLIKWLIVLLLRWKVPPRNGNKTLLLLDWDNFLMGLQRRFAPEEVKVSFRLKRLMAWVENECGELLEVDGVGKGFVFAPEHLNPFHREICVENNLQSLICPKRTKPDKNGSTDSVDEIIIWFGDVMLSHPEIGCLCIVSADHHFLPLLRKAKESGLKIAIAISAKGSISKQKSTMKEIMFLVDKSPKTGSKMFIGIDKLQ